MTNISHDGVEPVTDHVHENSWSTNLERPIHDDNEDALLDQAVDAIEKTVEGYNIDLLIHETHGHPESYLFSHLEDVFGTGIDYEFVRQCGRGGYVTRVSVE